MLSNFQTNEPSVIELQARLSYRTIDEEKVVLAGITGDVLYLKELFKLFLLNNEKKTTGCSDPSINAERPSSTITKRTTSSRASIAGSGADKIPINHQRTYLNQQIESWWAKHRRNMISRITF